MFNAHLMIGTDDRAFEQAPNAFNAVRMHVTNNPFLLRVINPLMLSVGILNSPIGGHFVCVDRFRVWRGVIMDKLMQRCLVSVGDNLQPNLSGALNCSNSYSIFPLVAESHTSHLTAHICFIHYHIA